MKNVIRKGDTTTHGGTVLEGVDNHEVMGIPVACKGHMVICPQCKGTYPILDGVEGMPVYGRYPAVEGMKTACGATLIASQSVFMLEVPNGIVNRGKQYGAQFILADREDEPMANMPYKILKGEEVYSTGTTDSHGRTEVVGEDEALDLHVVLDTDRLIGDFV